MRSIGGFEAPRWISNKISKSRPINHVRSNRDILRESDSRYSQRSGTWQMGVHHDLSPFGLNAAGGSPLDETERARKRPPTSLG